MMACIVENYNSHLSAFNNGLGSLAFGTAVAKSSSTRSAGTSGVASEDLLRDVFIPPSALHSHSPDPRSADPARLLEYYHRHPEALGAGAQNTSAVDLALLSNGEIPPAQQTFDVVEDLPQSVPLSLFQEQVAEPPWWESVLAVPIYNTLKERESALAPIQFHSPQLEQRQQMVDFLYAACERLLISHGTRFLAVRLMDHFMDKHIVMDYRMKLVALTCLLVAAKFEEADENLPTLECMQHLAKLGHLPDYYTREEFQKMELYLLKFFDWSISHPTSAHFADYFMTLADSVDDDIVCCCEREDVKGGHGTASSHDQGSADPVERKIHLENYNTYFLEATLREYVFLQYTSSLVAAAAVCASRICVGIPTAWSNKLHSTTGYSLEELSPVVDRMLRLRGDSTHELGH